MPRATLIPSPRPSYGAGCPVSRPAVPAPSPSPADRVREALLDDHTRSNAEIWRHCPVGPACLDWAVTALPSRDLGIYGAAIASDRECLRAHRTGWMPASHVLSCCLFSALPIGVSEARKVGAALIGMLGSCQRPGLP